MRSVGRIRQFSDGLSRPLPVTVSGFSPSFSIRYIETVSRVARMTGGNSFWKSPRAVIGYVLFPHGGGVHVFHKGLWASWATP